MEQSQERKYTKPDVLEQYVLRSPTGEKHLLQVEKEMNPGRNLGKRYLAHRPGDRWQRIGYMRREAEKTMVEVFHSLRSTREGTMTEQQRLAYYFMKAEEGEFDGYRLERIK